ncbi:hypothetical protein GCM10027040_12600 [Halomonas shantousis]
MSEVERHYSHTPASSGHRSMAGSDRLARGLGWFSIGLGLVQLCAPRTLTQALGAEGHERLVQACGAREIACGIGALTDNPAPSIWARVGGDVLDLAGLTMIYTPDNPKRENVGWAMTAMAATTALDLYCAQSLNKRHKAHSPAVAVYDYADRSGFPYPAKEMTGVADDFEVPVDMRATPPMMVYPAKV